MIIYYTKEGKFEVNAISQIPYSKLHREDGPAYISPNDVNRYFKNGKLHRTDGPAIEWCPTKYKKQIINNTLITQEHYIFNDWWLNGKKLNRKEVINWLNTYNIDLKNKKNQMLFMLKFG